MSDVPQSFHEVQSVFFRNATALSHNQITEKFSKFGVIESIHQTGTSRGLCFVKFTTERSAERCALAMRNDPTVQLQAFDPNSPNRAYKLRPGYSPGSCTKNKTNPVITDLEASPDEPNRNVSKEPRTIRSSNEPSYYSILRALEEKGPENKADNYPMISLDYYEDIIEASIDHFETIHPKTREESIKILSHVCKDIPEIVKKVTMLSEDETPKLEKSFYVLKRSQVQWEDLQGVDVEYVPAVAIVVGNIPMSCGVEIFLRMFEEYQPIVASKVKTTAEGLRYCWIHFREVCDCAAVEQRYDGVEVDGNFLVVQAAKMLKEE